VSIKLLNLYEMNIVHLNLFLKSYLQIEREKLITTGSIINSSRADILKLPNVKIINTFNINMIYISNCFNIPSKLEYLNNGIWIIVIKFIKINLANS